jgi:hypothetical protein
MIPPPEVTYPLDRETWEEPFDLSDESCLTLKRINNYITLMLVRYKHKRYEDYDLWEEFREGFEGWTTEIFSQASREAIKDLRTYLFEHGVWVREQKGSISYAQTLVEVLEDEEQHEWTKEEEERRSKERKRRIQTELPTRQATPNTPRTTITQPQTLHTELSIGQDLAQSEHIQREQQLRSLNSDRNERTDLPRQPQTYDRQYPPYQRFSPTPHPILSRERDPIQGREHQAYDQGRTQEPNPRNLRQGSYEATLLPNEKRGQPGPIPAVVSNSRLLTDLMKVYSQDDRKYGGDQYDVLDVRLQVFYDCCTKIGLGQDQYHLAFSIMLKGRAAEFYYDKLAGRSYDFATMTDMIRTHFETEENKQKYLSEWRETTLLRIIANHPDKTRLECLEITFDTLRTAQRGLSREYQTEHNLRDQVLNACRGVKECSLALFKPATTFEGLCADLRSAVGTAVREKQTVAYLQEKSYEFDQNWVDRQFKGKATRYPERRTNGNQFRTKRKSPMNSGTAPPTDKKCIVCGKLGCWSTNHSDEERKTTWTRMKGQLLTELDVSDDDTEAFLAEHQPEEVLEEEEEPEGLDFSDETFLTEYGEVNGPEAIELLADETTKHVLSRYDPMTLSDDKNESFIMNDRYSSKVFHGIIPDSGAAGISTAGKPQVQALLKLDPTIVVNRTTDEEHTIRFGKGTAVAEGFVLVQTPIGQVKFWIVPTNTPFLLCIQDMDKLGVRLDNLQNIIIQGEKRIPIVRRWGHPWIILDQMKVLSSYQHFTEIELRQLHRRFGHPSVHRLTEVLRRAGHEIENIHTIEKITKFCKHCQLNAKNPGRFRFSIKDDVEFNFVILVDIMFISGEPVLHAIDEATSFGAARFLKDGLADTVWNTLRTCWIDTYLGPPDQIVHDAGTNFASAEFRANARTMGVSIKEVPVEAHHGIGKLERYHAPLRRAYEIIWAETREEGLKKEHVLQMAIKAVNDTAGPNGLVPTLLVFGAYPRISYDSPPSAGMLARAKAVRTAMTELRKIQATRRIQDARRMRNGPDIQETIQLPIQSDVKVWREKKGWTGPYKLISTDGMDGIVQTRKGPVKFRMTVIKQFYEEPADKEEISEISRSVLSDMREANTDPTRPNVRPDVRPVVLIPFKRQADLEKGLVRLSGSEAFMSKKEELDLDLSRTMRKQGKIVTRGAPFEKSQDTEIQGLIKRGVFEFVRYDPAKHRGRIFNSRLVNEIKGKATDAPYEKSRLVIQAYNDAGKQEILTQSPTIQRISQRLILALYPSLKQRKASLYVRDITQAYIQSTTFLNRPIFAQPPKEIVHKYPKGTIMVVRRPLYGIPESGTHWWATYDKYHRENLHMSTSSYDPCLLISDPDKPFGIVGLQTDDTLILGMSDFNEQEEAELKKAGFLAKPKEMLSDKNQISFNGGIVKQDKDRIWFRQKGQGTNLVTIDLKSKDRTTTYREERARGAYVAMLCQPEASYDLSVAAQFQEPEDEDVRNLNKRITWQKENVGRGIQYVPIDLERMKLFVFVDGSFANNKDLSSQVGFVLILGNEDVREEHTFSVRGNLLHWSSTKSKRVTRSVLASEIYGMVAGVDIAIAVKATLDIVTTRLQLPDVPIVVCTDSFSLYECLVKLGTTKEKRLMIDIMALRQSYERRELGEIRWINGQSNPADAMTKANPNKSLAAFIDTNELVVRVEGWVKRQEKKVESGEEDKD